MTTRHPLTFRAPGLVLTILNSLEADNAEGLHPAVTELAHSIAEAQGQPLEANDVDDPDDDTIGPLAKTVRNTIHELLTLGAIRHRINRAGKTIGLELTDFGKAYGLLDPLTPQDLTTFPWPRDDGDGIPRWDTPLLTWPDAIPTAAPDLPPPPFNIDDVVINLGDTTGQTRRDIVLAADGPGTSARIIRDTPRPRETPHPPQDQGTPR